MSVKFKYVLVEFETKYHSKGKTNHWAENFKYSVQINDKIVFGDDKNLWIGRVIRRSNTLPKLENSYSVIATCNQFPVSDAPVQPELPVVSFPTVRDWAKKKQELHELTKTLEDTIIKVRNLV